MMHRLRRTLVHDWPILSLVALCLIGISMYLGVGPTTQEGSGYRVIDINAVRHLQDTGELSTHEAIWYQQRNESAENKK
jgi:hypothetical protein